MLIDFIRGYFCVYSPLRFELRLTLCMPAFTSAIAACRRIGRANSPTIFQALKRADIKLRREIRFADYRRAMHYSNKKTTGG